MPESPREKTTRKVVSALEAHGFSFYASVYLNADDTETNKRTIKRAKRLITEDNPDQLVFYFLSRNTNRETGEVRPYMSFYSHEKLVGVKLIAEQAKYPDAFKVSDYGGQRKRFISTNIEERYEGIINKIRDGKVFDLTGLYLPPRPQRYGYLNEKKQQIKQQLT